MSPESARLRRARERVEQATRTARLARIAAADDLRVGAERRSRWIRRGSAAALIVALVLAVIAGTYAITGRHAQERAHLDADVIAAASHAATVMLTSDPHHGAAYVDAVLAVSSGEQHDRIAAARDALMAAVAEQPAGTGQVLSAGLISDPTGDGSGDADRAQVLLVVQAANAALVGADPDAQRVTLRLSMLRSAHQWRVEQAATS